MPDGNPASKEGMNTMNDRMRHNDSDPDTIIQNKQNIDILYKQLKSSQLGVDVNQLKETHVDGKRVFVVKKESEGPVAKRTRQRSIRGSGSVIDDINNRLSDTEELIKDLEDKKLIVGMESYDLLDQLSVIAEKTEAAIHPLIELEEEIERRKTSVVDYPVHHRTFIEIQKLRQVGDIKSAEEIENVQGSDYREFRLIYRAMVPLLNQARELRLNLLREKRRLLNLQFNMMRKFLYWQVSVVFDLVNDSSCDSAKFDQYLEGLKPWQQLAEYRLSVWKQGTSVAKQISLLEEDIARIGDQVDEALPTASEYITKIYEFLCNEVDRSQEGSDET